MSGVLYQRPSHCKYCDMLFDFPTFTAEIHERNIPIRQRACRTCLEEMSKDPDLLEQRSREEAHRRSQVYMQFHQESSALSRQRSTPETASTSTEDSDATTGSALSPEQTRRHLRPQQIDVAASLQASPESKRSPSSLHDLLN